MATFPTGVKAFTTKNTGDFIQAATDNEEQEEITAIEQALLSSGFTSTATVTFGNMTVTSTISVGTITATNATISALTLGTVDTIALTGLERHTGIVTPAALTANQNNYNPTGIATARILRMTSDASRTVTGIAAQNNGQRLLIQNCGGFDIVLAHSSASSDAANRIICPGLANLTINAGDGVEIWYDGTSSQWRVVGL